MQIGCILSQKGIHATDLEDTSNQEERMALPNCPTPNFAPEQNSNTKKTGEGMGQIPSARTVPRIPQHDLWGLSAPFKIHDTWVCWLWVTVLFLVGRAARSIAPPNSR